MKIHYEKYDDTVQYLNNDKVDDWQPTDEKITVETFGDKLNITTEYADGEIYTTEMLVIDNQEGRIIAQHLDEHMGITIFVQNPEDTDEATLTLMNAEYIVGRYLKRVSKVKLRVEYDQLASY